MSASWPPPYHPPAAMPDLSVGLCIGHRAGLPADATPAEAEDARHACAACPALQRCREWAVTSMPGLGSFAGVIAGMSRQQIEAERARRRADDG